MKLTGPKVGLLGPNLGRIRVKQNSFFLISFVAIRSKRDPIFTEANPLSPMSHPISQHSESYATLTGLYPLSPQYPA